MSSARVIINNDPLFTISGQKAQSHRVVVPAAQGIPGPKGDPGSFEGFNDVALEFFRARKTPVKDISYQNGSVSRIDYISEEGDVVYRQKFLFDSELLVEIILIRETDKKTIRKLFHYTDDGQISKIITIGE